MTVLLASYAADAELLDMTTLPPPQRLFRRVLNRSASMTVLHENEASYDSGCGAPASDDNHDALTSYDVQPIVCQPMRVQQQDKLLRKKICSDEGSQGRYTLPRTLPRGNSCPDLASSSDAAAAAETQASSFPAIKIDAGFFKSYAQHIKNQRAMLSAQTA